MDKQQSTNNRNKTAKGKPKPKSRGKGFSQAETDALLSLLEEYHPISNMEWEYIAREHNTLFPEHHRDWASLKRKFTLLYGKKMPTGDPNCPQDVRRAKRCHEEIKEKCDLGFDGNEDNEDKEDKEEDSSVFEVDAVEVDDDDSSTSSVKLAGKTPVKVAAFRSTTTDSITTDNDTTTPNNKGIFKEFSKPMTRVGSKRFKKENEEIRSRCI